MKHVVRFRPAITGMRGRCWGLVACSPLLILLIYTANYRVTRISDTRPTPSRISYFHCTLRSGYLLIERNTTSFSGQEAMSRWIVERIPFASHTPRESRRNRRAFTTSGAAHARIVIPIWWLALVPLPLILPLVPIIEDRPDESLVCRCGYDLRGLAGDICPECGRTHPPAGLGGPDIRL